MSLVVGCGLFFFSSSHLASTDEIPDDFVEPTSEDLQRIAIMERERKRKEEADKSVLKTKLVRDMEFNKQMSKYKKVR